MTVATQLVANSRATTAEAVRPFALLELRVIDVDHIGTVRRRRHHRLPIRTRQAAKLTERSALSVTSAASKQDTVEIPLKDRLAGGGSTGGANLWAVVTEDDVRRLALALPGSYEQASYGGRPSWRTAPRMFAWLRDDPEALVVWVEAVEDKEALIAADPVKFFTTVHYEGQPIVLVRLEAIDAEEAAELIVDSWLFRAPRSLTRAVGDRPQLISTVTPPSREDLGRRASE